MSRIVLGYLAKAKYGGWPTFTRHLHAALKAAGMSPVIRTVGAKTAMMPHDFGHGLMARRLSISDLLSSKDPVLIAAADKDHAEHAKALVAKGANIVVHDPAEKHLAGIPPERTVVIRRSMKARLPKSNFIPHPYERRRPDRNPILPAVAHSRIDFDKYTHLILEAKDLGSDIRIFGAPNPMYIHFKIHPKWPDFAVEPFPRDAHAGADLCATARTVIDMSAIKNDGGGSQYSFLEAWDARSPLIINRKWVAAYPDDEMQDGVNCIAAADGREIKEAIDRIREDQAFADMLVANGEKALASHDPAVVGASYRQVLGF